MGSPGSTSGLAGGRGGAGAGGDGGAGAGGGGGEGDSVSSVVPTSSIFIASSAAPKSGQVIATARTERAVFLKCMTKIENQEKEEAGKLQLTFQGLLQLCEGIYSPE